MDFFDFSPARGGRVSAARFASATGPTEVHLCALPAPGPTFEDQLASLCEAYEGALLDLGLLPESAVFVRLFVSDAANQVEVARRFEDRIHGGVGVSVSTIQQPPGDRKIALWAHHVAISGGDPKVEAIPSGARLRRHNLTHLWLSGLGGPGSVADQTRHAFGTLIEALGVQGASLRDHAVRTWIYVRDIDRNYGEMVQARRELFERHGLSSRTHTLASTGIEGCTHDPNALVTLDAYAIAGLDPGQVRFLHAPSHLGPAAAYGLTFERGTRIDLGDRVHTFISGTASIDPTGQTLHLGDVKLQTERATANVRALLDDAGAKLSDVAMLLAYLRDPTDLPLVEECLRASFEGIPMLFLAARVCRPGWLVEIECIAITTATMPAR